MSSLATRPPSVAAVTVSPSASQLSDVSRSLQLLQSQFLQLTDTIASLSTAFLQLSTTPPAPPLDADSPPASSNPGPDPAEDDEDGPQLSRSARSDAEGDESDGGRRENSQLMRAIEDEEKQFDRPAPLYVDRPPTALYTVNSKPANLWRKAGQPPSTPSFAAPAQPPSNQPPVTQQPTVPAGVRRVDSPGSAFSPQSPPLTSSIIALPPLMTGHARLAFPFPSPQAASSRSPQLSAARRKSMGSEDAAIDSEESKRPSTAAVPAQPTPVPTKRSTTPLPSSTSSPSQASVDARAGRSASIESSSTFTRTALKTATGLDHIADEERAPALSHSPHQHPHPHPFPSSTPTSPTAKHIFLSHPNKIKLNVGGTVFHTTLSTLVSPTSGGSMLSSMFSGHFPLELDSKGAYFLDRDPSLFRHILNFLRDGSLPLSSLSLQTKQSLLRESRYFGLSTLTHALHAESREAKARQRRELSSEKEYKLCDVDDKDLPALFNKMTIMEGYDFEDWLRAVHTDTGTLTKPRGASLGSLAGVGGKTEPGKSIYVLFSKKLSRGELMLLDRLQTGM